MANDLSTKSLKDKNAEQTEKTAQELAHQPASTTQYDGVLSLQRSVGNQAIGQLLRTSTGASSNSEDGIPAGVHSVLTSNAGQSLDIVTRKQMESQFGRDFSHVRVHTDVQASESARAFNAKAYTIGRDIVFSPGRYTPHSRQGRELIAHELAHVIQQERGGGAPVLNPGAAHERGAEAAAKAAISGEGPVTVSGATGVGVARDWDPDIEDIEKALEPLKESPDKPATPGKQKALTPDELIDDHVFGPRVHEEVGDLRKRITKLETELEKKPNDAELKRKVEAMRQELRVLEGKPLDPASKGTKVPGHGNINTRAAIQIVDKDGNLIALERGRWKPGVHAEEDAIAKLRKRLGNTKLPPGSRIVVAGNQVVCSDVCRPALKQFADDYQAKEVAAHVRVRPKIVGKGTASGKTTERTGLTKDAPKPHVTSETLYQRVGTKPPQSSPAQGMAPPTHKPTVQKPQTGEPSATAQPKVSTHRAKNTDFQTQGNVIHREGSSPPPEPKRMRGLTHTSKKFSPKGAALAELLPAAMNALQDKVIRHRVATEMLQKWSTLEAWRREHPNDWIVAVVSLREWEQPDPAGQVARVVNYVDFFHGPTQQEAEAQASKILRSGVPKGWREVGPFLGWIAPTDSLDELEEKVKEEEGCFIATACYNSALAPEVYLLREFRDMVLKRSRPGRIFISIYYLVSPPIAALLRRHALLRTLVRSLLLTPLTAIVRRSADRWPRTNFSKW